MLIFGPGSAGKFAEMEMNLHFGENIGNSSFRSWHTNMQTHAGASQPSSSCRFITYNHTHISICNQYSHPSHMHTTFTTVLIHHIQPHTSQPSHPSHIHSPSNEDVERESAQRRKIEHEVWEMFPHIYRICEER